MKTNYFLIAVIFLALINLSGIYRHDVDEKEYRALAAKPEYSCVVQLFSDSVPIGSGVIIDNMHILTAAHLFDDYKGNNLNFRFYSKDSNKINIASFVLHPQYKLSGDCDLAICKLERPVEVPFPKLYREFKELSSTVVGVGFGASGKSNEIDKISSSSIKIAGENVVDSIGGFKYDGVETILFYDFDDPERPKYNKLGSPLPRPLEFITSGGDSGGGLFMTDSTGELQLLGITKGGGINPNLLVESWSYYGQVGTYTRVSPFISWIQNQL